MPSLADLLVKVGIDATGLVAGVKGISDEFKGIEKEARSTERSLAGFVKIGDRLASVGTTMTAAITLPIVGIGAAAVVTAGKMEQAQIAFEGLLGSAQKAGEFLGELKQFAAKTPFEFPDLVEASKRMLALGFEANKIIPTLRIIGDTAAGLGAGSEGINRITLALGQMSAKGKVSAQEMNQLAEVGIKAWEMLASKIGVSIPEAMKLAERGAIEASVAVPAILEGMNAKFSGQMARQAETVRGQWSNLKDEIGFVLEDIGKALEPFTKLVLDVAFRLVGVIKNLAQAFSELPQPVQIVVLGLVAVAAAAGPLLVAVGSLLAAIPSISAGLAVLGGVSLAGLVVVLKVAAVAAIGLTAAFLAWKFQDYIPGILLLKGAIEALTEWFGFLLDKFKLIPGVATAINKLTGGAKGVQAEITKATKSVTAFGKGLFDTGKTTEQITEMQKKFAEMLGTSTKKVKEKTEAASKLVNVNELVHARAKAVEEAYRKQVQQLAEAQLHYEKMGSKTIDLAEALGQLVAEINYSGAAAKDLPTLPGYLAKDLEAATAGIDKLGAAYKHLGMSAPGEAKRLAEESRKAFELIRDSGIATPRDIKVAWVKWQEDVIAAAKAAGEKIPEEQLKALEKMKAEIGEGKGKEVVSAAKNMMQQVSTIVTNFAQDAAKSLFDGDLSWGEKFKKLWGNLKEAAVATFIEPVTKAISDFITGALTDLISGKGLGGVLDQLGSIGKAVTGLFGGGASGAASAAGGATGGAGGAAGSVGSVGSAAGGAVAAAVTAIASAVSAVTGVIGVFQNAKQEDTLNAIEESTRRTSIITEEILVRGVNQFLSELPVIRELASINVDQHAWRIHDVWDQLVMLNDQLRFDTNPMLGNIERAVAGEGSRTVTINFNGNVANRSDMDYAVREISRNLR